MNDPSGAIDVWFTCDAKPPFAFDDWLWVVEYGLAAIRIELEASTVLLRTMTLVLDLPTLYAQIIAMTHNKSNPDPPAARISGDTDRPIPDSTVRCCSG